MLTVMILSIIWFFLVVGVTCLVIAGYYFLTGDGSSYVALIILIKVLSTCFVIVLAAAIGAKAVGL
jgi:hypothetical protein